MSTTKNLGLKLYGASDDDYITSFQDWRRVINDELESNSIIIDEAIGAVNQDIVQLGSAIVGFQSGTAALIENAANVQLLSLVSNITPIQEGAGDPSLDNIRPISAHNELHAYASTSNNLLDNLFPEPKTFTSGNISVTIKPRYGFNSSLLIDILSSGNAGAVTIVLADAVFPAGEYRLPDQSSSKPDYRLETVRVTKNSDGTETVTSSGAVDNVLVLDAPTMLRFQVVAGASTVSWAIGFDLTMTVYGSSVKREGTALWHVTEELPEAVYGGTLDWTTGVLTVIPYVLMESPVPTEAGVREASNGVKYVTVARAGDDKCSDSAKVLCSHYRTAVGLSTSGAIRYANGQFFVYDDSATDDNYTTLLEGVQILYPTAGDPKTIQLTPHQLTMLKGENSIWSSAGNTDVMYVVDTKLYIDNKFERLEQAIVVLGETT